MRTQANLFNRDGEQEREVAFGARCIDELCLDPTDFTELTNKRNSSTKRADGWTHGVSIRTYRMCCSKILVKRAACFLQKRLSRPLPLPLPIDVREKIFRQQTLPSGCLIQSPNAPFDTDRWRNLHGGEVRAGTSQTFWTHPALQ